MNCKMKEKSKKAVEDSLIINKKIKIMNRLIVGLLGLCTGIGIGTVIGILYAPDTGTNTRDKITFRLDKYKDKLEELLEELIRGRDLQENSAKSEGEKVITDAKEKAERLLMDVEELLTQIKGQK